MKSLAKFVGSITRAFAIPVLCSLPVLLVMQQRIGRDSVRYFVATADREMKHRSAIQTMAQANAEGGPAAEGAPPATPLPRVVRDVGKEGKRIPANEVSTGPLQVPEKIQPNVAVPPIHGSDEPPPGYPNYYAPAPLNQPNPYPRNVQPAPPND
jgi:hypothetical protein